MKHRVTEITEKAGTEISVSSVPLCFKSCLPTIWMLCPDRTDRINSLMAVDFNSLMQQYI